MSLFLVYARLKTNRTKTNIITNSFQGMVSISKKHKSLLPHDTKHRRSVLPSAGSVGHRLTACQLIGVGVLTECRQRWAPPNRLSINMGGVVFQQSAGNVEYRPTACRYIDHWGEADRSSTWADLGANYQPVKQKTPIRRNNASYLLLVWLKALQL